ncbi:MAG TPA: hypothetical protein VMX55_10095 [candidate division Zixibacteria bacterium]|nr:hypothetical protein [candidate division Zixibacteria bacterium]
MDLNEEYFEGNFEEQLIAKVSKMTNIELRDALLEVRKLNIKGKINSIEEIDENTQKSLIIEGIYTEELKRRELLEWALRTAK